MIFTWSAPQQARLNNCTFLAHTVKRALLAIADTAEIVFAYEVECSTHIEIFDLDVRQFSGSVYIIL